MNGVLARVHILLAQERYDRAVVLLREALASLPNDATLHSLMAITLSELKQLEQAAEHARQAVAQAPDFAESHFALGLVMVERRRLSEAYQATRTAISLAPHDPRYFWQLSRIHYLQHQWQKSLDAAEQGLALDPQHRGCSNLQAAAKLALGEFPASRQTSEASLQQRPDDAYAHACRGWVLVNERKWSEAGECFRAALRLQPDLQWAREGMVEALKGRYWLYRIIMTFRRDQLRNARGCLTQACRFAWLAGCVLTLMCFAAIPLLTAGSPPPPPTWLVGLVSAFLVTSIGVMLADPLATAGLLLHPLGRLILGREEIWAVRTLGFAVALVTGFVVLAALGDIRDMIASLLLLLAAVPASLSYRCSQGWPRTTSALVSVAVFALGLVAASPVNLFLSPDASVIWRDLRVGVMMVYLFSVFMGSAIIAMLARAVPRQ